jgi:FkbM family methyltransferase
LGQVIRMILLKKYFKLQKNRYIFLLLVLILTFLFTFINSCKEFKQKRYVYIIGGAYKGERINIFKTQDIYYSHPWEIFAIEANPYIIDEIPRAPDTIIINKAIGVKDGFIKFYFSPQSNTLNSVYEESLGTKCWEPITYYKFFAGEYGEVKFFFLPNFNYHSTCYKEKYGGQAATSIFIESIDFGQWLKRNFTINDYIVVSLDIEGAEYDVLNKMLMDNTIQYIDDLAVECHSDIGGKSENDFKELLKKINKLNIHAVRAYM